MGSVNEVTIVGNLGADPELRFTANKIAICNMRVATSYKPKDGQAKTEWHRVAVWREQAANCAKYLKKGGQVYVRGRLETREYTTQAGEKRFATEIVAEKIVFLGSAKDRAPANDQQRQAPANDPGADTDFDPENWP